MKNVILALFLFTVAVACAQQASKHELNLSKSGVAVEGYDVVSYFDASAQKGSKVIASIYKGATYFFSSKKNKEKFDLNPLKYTPQYGGWCAYAMGDDGSKVSINPKTYKILDGKLYLFYNKFGINTLKSWNKDEAKLKAKADENWGK